MQRYLTFTLVLALALALGGCGGERKLRTTGRLLKGGQPATAREGEHFRVIFVPIMPEGKPARNFYAAVVDGATGTFTAAGPDLKGLPAGKYRVAVEWMSGGRDTLGGKFNIQTSPFVFDIDSSTKEIVLDLDKPPGG